MDDTDKAIGNRSANIMKAAGPYTTKEAVDLLTAYKEVGATAHTVIDIIRAVDGLTAKEAVRYLEHGREMVIDMEHVRDYLADVSTNDRGYETACLMASRLLADAIKRAKPDSKEEA
jgi:hypothetical protein